MLRDSRWPARTSDTFTLQWHLTDACEYRCRHCYMDAQNSGLSSTEAIDVLSQLETFCARRNVLSHLCLTGGNPVLYPHFFEVYAQAAQRMHRLSILGNPVAERELSAITALRIPAYYQVSLEGLEEHNDAVRGEGHFRRTLDFLSLLREYHVSAHVQLTLTQDNYSQVLPLAERLGPLIDVFTFNRLAQVGAGSRVEPCDGTALRGF